MSCFDTNAIIDVVTTNHKREQPAPILTHLTADNTWLLSLPNPSTERPRAPKSEGLNQHSKRAYFHVLVDPWLEGELTQSYRWIVVVKHVVQPSFRRIDDVRQLILSIESAARSGHNDTEDDGEVDMVFITHYLIDHCDRHTLTQLGKHVPVITVPRAAEEIRSWKHFDEDRISTMPDLDETSIESLWQSSEEPSNKLPMGSDQCRFLPDWLRVGRLPSKESYPQFHWAIIIAFSSTHLPLAGPQNDVSSNGHDSGRAASRSDIKTLFFSPHGVYPDRLVGNCSFATEHSSMLALIHGLDPAWTPAAANLGLDAGIKVARYLRPKYWIPTHDEHVSVTGLLGLMSTKKKEDDKRAQAMLEEVGYDDTGTREVVVKRHTEFRDVGNGESILLAY